MTRPNTNTGNEQEQLMKGQSIRLDNLRSDLILSGPAVFVDDAELQGLPPGPAVVATLLALVSDHVLGSLC